VCIPEDKLKFFEYIIDKGSVNATLAAYDPKIDDSTILYKTKAATVRTVCDTCISL
jgi:hypothetical protein